MNRSIFKDVQTELAACLLMPVVVLLLIAVPGHLYVAKLKRGVERKGLELAEIPLLAHKLDRATRLLAPYRLRDASKDHGGEMSQLASQPATEQGVTVKSVNAEKLLPAESPCCLDYRIAMTGEGPLGAVVRTMDVLDHPSECFRVVSLQLKAKSFSPPVLYDAAWVFRIRYLAPKSAPPVAVPADMEPILKRADANSASLEGVARRHAAFLTTGRLDRRKGIVAEDQVEVPEGPLPFRLNGIVRNGHMPLALTDHGVQGEGSVIEGYRIIRVGEDHVIVIGPQGRQEKVPLYKAEDQP